jgi:hypothetical protein
MATKYAFILGSNSFITPYGAVTYTDGAQTRLFLSIRSIYHNTGAGSRLSVDLDIKDMLDRELKLTDNEVETNTGFNIIQQRDRVLITKHNGDTIIDIHQLDNESAMSLEHNIVAELEVHAPIVAIRLRGSFMLGRMHIEIDNEKLFINGNSYANSTQASKNNLKFEEAGVVF